MAGLRLALSSAGLAGGGGGNSYGSSESLSVRRPATARPVCIRVYVYTFIRVYVYTFIRVYVYTCIRLYVYTCIRNPKLLAWHVVYVYRYMYTCIDICMRV